MSDFWLRVETLPLATHIAETWWFPLLESLHVVGMVVLIGAILMVDLRLMRIAAGHYSHTTLIEELTPWAWAGFVLACVTGVGLFITRASAYVENTAFLIKVVLLILAGANVAWLHGRTLRTPAHPFMLRSAGAVSLVVWAGVVLTGRWIGHLS